MTTKNPHHPVAEMNALDTPRVRAHIADYHGWFQESGSASSFQQLLTHVLTNGLSSESPITVARDRVVYRLHDAQWGDIYLKRYEVRTLKQHLQTFLRVHNAQKSVRIADRLLKKGIQTPRPIAYFTRRIAWNRMEHLVVTEGVADEVSLRDYVRSQFQETPAAHDDVLTKKRSLLRHVADFLSALHRAGVYHGDFTARNILVKPLPSDRFQIFLIDLDAIRSTRGISFRRRMKNLDELGRNFVDLRVITTADRARFLKRYWQTTMKDRLSYKQLFTTVLRRTRVRLHKHQQHFVGAKTPPNVFSSFPVKETHGWKLHVFSPWQSTFPSLDAAVDFLSNPDRVLQDNTRGQVFLTRYQGTLFTAKRSLRQENRWWSQVTSLYRSGEGARTLRNLSRLHDAGIPVPEPVFTLEQRRFGCVIASWGVYRYLEGQPCTCAQADQVAATLKALHARGWVHRDPHVKNFLSHEGHLHIIDCARARPWRSTYARMYDVVLLNNCCPGSLHDYGVTDTYTWWVYRLAKAQNNLIKFWRRVKRTLRSRNRA